MKILLLGKDGQLGWELQRSLSPLGELIATNRNEADFEDLDNLRACVRQHNPDLIVNAAAYTAVDKAEAEPDLAYRINAEAVGVLADEAARSNAWLIHYSTDYVFDGEQSVPYRETDATGPLSVYGSSKLQGEQQITERHAKHLIFRTSWIHATRGNNFVKRILQLATEKEHFKVVDDQYGSPTSAELIADTTALVLHRIVQHTETPLALAGTYHLAAAGDTTWHGYAQYILEQASAQGIALKAGVDAAQAIPTKSYQSAAARPRNSRLNCEKLTRTFDLHLPDWRYHVQRLVTELAANKPT